MQLQGQAFQSGPIPTGDLPSLVEDLRGHFQLRHADRGTDVIHPEVKGNGVVPVFAIRRNSLASKVHGSIEQVLVAGSDHSAFAGGNRLVPEETEGGHVSESADFA